MGVFVNEGLVSIWKSALGQTQPITSRYADLILAPFTNDKNATYAGLTWAGLAVEIGATDWAVALNAALGLADAVRAVTFTCPSTMAGSVLYGVGYFGLLPGTLFTADTLPAPFQIPVGGSSFSWSFNLLFGSTACPAPLG